MLIVTQGTCNIPVYCTSWPGPGSVPTALDPSDHLLAACPYTLTVLSPYYLDTEDGYSFGFRMWYPSTILESVTTRGQ
jgi:hypothetical protein